MADATRNKPAYVTFSQNLDPKYWPGWDAGIITRGDSAEIGAECVRRIEAAGGEVSGAWLNRHDQDRYSRDDAPSSDKIGSPKMRHVHGIIQQGGGRNSAKRLHCVEIDRALGFAGSVVRAPSRGGRIENALAYLIHAKDPDKFQYDPSLVATVRGLDYREIQAANAKAWARRAVMGRTVSVSAKEWADLTDAVVQKVLDGEVDELDILNDKTLGDIYARGKAKIDLALQFHARRHMAAEVAKINAGDFKKSAIWLMGGRDQGKTYLATGLARELSARVGWRVFLASAKNGLDNYTGQEVILANEPGSGLLEWADLLVLLDPRYPGPISRRYTNAPDAAPRVVILAVSVDPVEFGFFIPGKRSTSDHLDQLLRRLAFQVIAKKQHGEPRYLVSRMGEVEPYQRLIEIPTKSSLDRGWENLNLSIGPVNSVAGLDNADAIEQILCEIQARCPDVDLKVDPTVIPLLTPAEEEAEMAAIASYDPYEDDQRGVVVQGQLVEPAA